MNRRSILAASGFALAGAVVGHSTADDPTPRCKLMHEVVQSSDHYGEPIETYRHEDLGDDARHVFEEALADGGYATADWRLKPDEFRYWDTVAVYNVTYRNETHVLLTYTGAGCEGE